LKVANISKFEILETWISFATKFLAAFL